MHPSDGQFLDLPSSEMFITYYSCLLGITWPLRQHKLKFPQSMTSNQTWYYIYNTWVHYIKQPILVSEEPSTTICTFPWYEMRIGYCLCLRVNKVLQKWNVLWMIWSRVNEGHLTACTRKYVQLHFFECIIYVNYTSTLPKAFHPGSIWACRNTHSHRFDLTIAHTLAGSF